ncbi:zinc-dependent alcohol dehydrogenase [Pseudogemmobacter faecipullorum]|uniref:Alcohol dehydrogenase catalytic domain-containing protein n=1 Tax=Pseudogemmobacter faecipullorum TaxID=2755041 RepID=A0ABS8CJD5_9RHOB|nr:alcohol dehydrogenase catalytic domain-containing protein [Pseudogemmobacter faecipullorum]MCB5409503.1 alcohol dehydrogenase catalytic domain-containing protein [Pseudogemmobacter faecipullorum]
MRAVRLWGVRDLRVEDIPLPAPPGKGEVTLRVTAAGICGSDLHNFATGAWISRSPSVAGHEFAGVVTGIGPEVGNVTPGDTVAVDSRVICGSCQNCREGLGQICEKLGFLGEVIDGGFAEYVTLPARNVVKAPARIPARHLAMAEPLAVALHAVTRLNAPQGAPVLVTGAGAIGALSALVLASRGHPVQVADRNQIRATRAASAADGQVVSLDALAHPAPRYALDATGSPEVIAQLLQSLRGGGAIALVGIGSRDLSFNPTLLVEREIALIGCHAFGDELAEAVALLPALEARLDQVIDAQIPLEAVPAAYDLHLNGALSGAKTIILPEAEP